ncbi:hypothetical protein R6Q57_025053 [Mikania cordata]
MANPVAEVVFIPGPGVGHLISSVEMAKALVNRDQRLSATVLLISPFHPILALSAYIESLAKNPIERIRFIEVPRPQTPQNFDLKTFLTSFYEFINSHCKSVRNIVADMINQSASGRLVGFVVDILCTGMIDVANEFKVPAYVFYTCNSAFLGFNLHIETQYVDQNQDLVKLSHHSEGDIAFPCFVNLVPMRVVRAVFQKEDPLDFLVHSFRDLRKAKGIMVNSFLELETHAFQSFSDIDFPHVYPVGPLLNLDGVAGMAEDTEVISWLDAQPASSVVVLCFGSMGSFNEAQVKEIARGLERSGHRFVWSLRLPFDWMQSSDVVSDNYNDPGVLLPDGFLERTMGIGKVIRWAPQVALLAHDAVGGFVSHCGWNSLQESLWFGVPTAAWPLYAEQQMNAFEMVVELGLAIDLKMDYSMNMFNPESEIDVVTAEEIERGIRRLMEDDEVRAKVKEMAKLSRATVAQGGSSYASVGYLVQEIMSNII